MVREKNVILLPANTDLYHPDLVHAADAVVAKLGYSTVAETYSAGVPLGIFLAVIFRSLNIWSHSSKEK